MNIENRRWKTHLTEWMRLQEDSNRVVATELAGLKEQVESNRKWADDADHDFVELYSSAGELAERVERLEDINSGHLGASIKRELHQGTTTTLDEYERKRAERYDVEIMDPANEPQEGGDWWCPTCKRRVDSDDVVPVEAGPDKGTHFHCTYSEQIFHTIVHRTEQSDEQGGYWCVKGCGKIPLGDVETNPITGDKLHATEDTFHLVEYRESPPEPKATDVEYSVPGTEALTEKAKEPDATEQSDEQETETPNETTINAFTDPMVTFSSVEDLMADLNEPKQSDEQGGDCSTCAYINHDVCENPKVKSMVSVCCDCCGEGDAGFMPDKSGFRCSEYRQQETEHPRVTERRRIDAEQEQPEDLAQHGSECLNCGQINVHNCCDSPNLRHWSVQPDTIQPALDNLKREADTQDETKAEGMELKPCPFCGGEAELGWGISWDQVHCPSCKARVYSTSHQAITAWNKRSDIQLKEAEIVGLKDEVERLKVDVPEQNRQIAELWVNEGILKAERDKLQQEIDELKASCSQWIKNFRGEVTQRQEAERQRDKLQQEVESRGHAEGGEG